MSVCLNTYKVYVSDIKWVHSNLLEPREALLSDKVKGGAFSLVSRIVGKQGYHRLLFYLNIAYNTKLLA